MVAKYDAIGAVRLADGSSPPSISMVMPLMVALGLNTLVSAVPARVLCRR
ncbi:MAG: hypothetical protein U0521_21875 [Anaerolineae bacterium]